MAEGKRLRRPHGIGKESARPEQPERQCPQRGGRDPARPVPPSLRLLLGRTHPGAPAASHPLLLLRLQREIEALAAGTACQREAQREHQHSQKAEVPSPRSGTESAWRAGRTKEPPAGSAPAHIAANARAPRPSASPRALSSPVSRAARRRPGSGEQRAPRTTSARAGNARAGWGTPPPGEGSHTRSTSSLAEHESRSSPSRRPSASCRGPATARGPPPPRTPATVAVATVVTTRAARPRYMPVTAKYQPNRELCQGKASDCTRSKPSRE